MQWWLKKVYEITPICFIDKNKAGERLNEIEVLSLEEFKIKSATKCFFVIISIADYHREVVVKKEIEDYLKTCTIGGYVDLWDTRILWPFKEDWWNKIQAHSTLYNEVYNNLVDNLSKETMVEYLKVFILGQRYQGKTFAEEYKYWGIDGNQDRLFKTKEDEVVVDVGASAGDTIYQYLRCQLPFKKIIGVEADAVRQVRVHNWIHLLPDKVQTKVEIIDAFFGQNEDTIDCVFKNEHVSLVLMDVEGNEMEVLKTGVKTIVRDRPVLAICAYHRWDDLIRIPRFIRENCKDYVIVLRKYASNYMPYFDGIQQCNELVLYGIPVERYIGQERT